MLKQKMFLLGWGVVLLGHCRDRESPPLPRGMGGPGPYAAITAGLQVLPEGLHLGQVHLVERDGHLSNGIIAAEAVVVQDLEVQHPLYHLLVGEPCDRDGKAKGDEEQFQDCSTLPVLVARP